MDYIKIPRHWIRGNKKSTTLDKIKGLPVTWHCTQGRRRGGWAEVHFYSFLFNNQPDALFIQIYCHKTLLISGNFFAHHQDRFQAESGWNFHPESAWKQSSEPA